MGKIDQLKTSARTIKTNELPNSNTALLIGSHLEGVNDVLLEHEDQLKDAASTQEVKNLIEQSEAQRQAIFEQNEAQRQELPKKLSDLELKAALCNDISGEANVDLRIADDNGNVLVEFADGHIKTKEFNSAEVNDLVEQPIVTTDYLGVDIAITDEDGNVLVEFADGHIKTKEFNSAEIRKDNDFPGEITLDVEKYKTDILATSRNYILREVTENGKKYFLYSNDSGCTFNKNENPFDKILFIHFFSNGLVLVCTNTKCYTTIDFLTFEESNVRDIDGSVFSNDINCHSLYRLGNYNSEYTEIDGIETLIWADYNAKSGFIGRLWMSQDYGRSIKCILKSGVSKDTNENIISVRHFHRSFVESDKNICWVTSGDSGNECKLLKGTVNNGIWSWETIGQGDIYKLSQIEIKRPYARFVTDYTNNVNDTGLITCPVIGLRDSSNFRYVFKTDGKQAMSKLFEDDNGNRVFVGDGAVYNKIWVAIGNYNFKKVSVKVAPINSDTFTFSNVYGPNDIGQVVMKYNTSADYSSANNPVLDSSKMFILSDLMRDYGVLNFGNIIKR